MEDREGLKLLAFVDESEPYEVDYVGLYLNESSGKFIVVSASGCSCWEGEEDVQEFDSLDEVEKAFDRDGFAYNPSILGGKQLIEEARRVIA